MNRWWWIRTWAGLASSMAAVALCVAALKAPTGLKVVQAPVPQTAYLTWDDPSDPAPFTIEYEVWHSSVLTSNQFTMLAVVPFIGCRVTNNGVQDFFIVRSRYAYDTNLVSDWNR